MLLLLVGCAPREGWRRTEQSCVPDGPPRVCVADNPDRQLVVRAGGVRLVPGECMEAAQRRGGRLRVTMDDGRTGRTSSRWIGVRRGEVTRVGLRDGPVVRGRTDCPAAR